MEFDVFEKLSDLETKIHLQKEELKKKDTYIQQLTDQNNFLLQQLESHMKEIAILRKSQHSEIAVTVDQEVQTDADVVVTESKVVDSAFAGAEASIADILKQTSDSVTSNSGYVYDEQTGLYFDKNSGYYYDPENQLFFEPRSGMYYTYNSETQEYSYHSSVSSELSGKFKALLDKTKDEQEISKVTVDQAANLHPPPSRKTHVINLFSSTHSYRRNRLRVQIIGKGIEVDDVLSLCPLEILQPTVATIEMVGIILDATVDIEQIEDPDVTLHLPVRIPGVVHHRRDIIDLIGEVGTTLAPRLRRVAAAGVEIVWGVRSRSQRRFDHFIRAPDLFTANAVSDQPNGACIAATPVVYPPSVRLTVLATATGGPAVGSVGVITSRDASRGLGCLGSNSQYCHVFDLSQDAELDEIHCEITFNESNQSYFVRDKKTAGGTYLNGNKLEKNEKKQISHGDVLRIGGNKLLIHIHPGRETCGQCEASEIKAAIESVAITAAASTSTEQTAAAPAESTQNVNSDAVKVKYGLKKNKRRSGPRQRAEPVLNDQPQYQDRAAKRRALEKAMNANTQALGGAASAGGGISSSGPVGAASVLTPIDESNVGARLLSKMGWNKGEGLGREKGGIAEPDSAGEVGSIAQSTNNGSQALRETLKGPSCVPTARLTESIIRCSRCLLRDFFRFPAQLSNSVPILNPDSDFDDHQTPISATMRLDHRAGLGFGPNAISIDSTPSELRQARALSVTRERFRQIEERERQGQA
ncbi:hypothetical protein Aperf_G00000068632 [Anoplocephala perfoliata]